MQISSIRQNNQTINFKAVHKLIAEISYEENIPTLVHTTQFFRYDDLDELVVKKLKQKQLLQNKPLNILSAGCSYGEEVYSYAVALNNERHKPNIIGIDMSDYAINEAKKGRYKLDINERELLQANFSLPRTEILSKYNIGIRKKFNQDFKCVNSKNGIFQKRRNAFTNCDFKQGNILDLDSFCKNNSQDVILCRNVLYHLEKNEIPVFVKKAYDALKKGGLVCLGPNEYAKYQHYFSMVGFKQPFKNAPSIFKKPHKLFKFI